MNFIVDTFNTRHKVERYFLDTHPTLTQRIAVVLHTLPEFLYVYWDTTPIRVVDLWRECRQQNDLMVVMTTFPMFDEKDRLQLWVLEHTDLFQFLRVDPVFTNRFGQVFEEVDMDTERVRRHLSERRAALATSEKRIRDAFKYYHNIPSYPITELKTENMLQRIRFTSPKDGLDSVFNDLHTTPNIPILMYKEFYKLQRDFIPSVNWQPVEHKIVAKYQLPDQTFSHIEVFIQNSEFVVEMERQTLVDTRDILTALLGSVRDHTIVDVSLNHVGGYFASTLEVDNRVLEDVLMTYPFLPDWLCVNDNTQNVGKYGNRILYFQHPETKEHVQCSIVRRVAVDDSLYPQNTPYIKFKILRSPNNDVIDMFQTLVSKVLRIYADNAKTIQQEYTRYIAWESPPPPKPRGRKPKHFLPQPQKKHVFMKDLHPAIFQSTVESEMYTRKCQSNKQPVLMSEEEAKQFDKERWLTFPKESDSTIAPTQYYVCLDDEYKYPGLIQFGNALGVAPCCFKREQTGKKIYKKYYENVDLPAAQQPVYFKTSDKILLGNEYGFFPSKGKITNDIGSFFEKMRLPQRILRRGVDTGSNSFLHCVLDALQIPTFIHLTPEQKQVYLRRERRKLVEFLVLGKQEMYDMTLTEMESYLQSDDWLSPEKTIRIVETVYNCNILLFDRTDSFGKIHVPRHSHGYCQFQRDDTQPSIFIYVHMGAETDYLAHPHCELILSLSEEELETLRRYPDTLSTRPFWREDDPGYGFCWEVYDVMSTYVYRDKLFQTVPRTLGRALHLRRQYVDPHGKVRRLELSLFGKHLIVETTPLPPFHVPLMDAAEQPTLLPLTTIVQLMNLFQLRSPTQYDIERRAQYLEGWLSNWCQLRMYVDSPAQFIYPRQPVSLYTLYHTNHQLARVLTNWYIYLFSKFLHLHALDKVTDNLLQRFHRDHITLIPDYTYSKEWLSDTFRTPNRLLQGDRLICTSEEMVERLAYQLRLIAERNWTRVRDFHLKRNLENFYMSSSDFTTHPNELILTQKDMRLTEHLRRPHSHTLHSTPLLESDTPYFLQHPLLTHNKIVLAHPFTTLEQAVQNTKHWLEDGVHEPHKKHQYDPTFPYHLYTLSNQDKVELYQVRPGMVHPQMDVVATAPNQFTSLLHL